MNDHLAVFEYIRKGYLNELVYTRLFEILPYRTSNDISDIVHSLVLANMMIYLQDKEICIVEEKELIDRIYKEMHTIYSQLGISNNELRLH